MVVNQQAKNSRIERREVCPVPVGRAQLLVQQRKLKTAASLSNTERSLILAGAQGSFATMVSLNTFPTDSKMQRSALVR